jgi:L-lactate dehydrogenase complex protein LldF
MSVHVGQAAEAPAFPVAARKLLGNAQLRRNVRHATDVIRAKRAKVVAEAPDWQELRDSARHLKDHVLANLDRYLEQFERRCTSAGGKVHWARDADEANRIVVEILLEHQAKEIIKVKTMTSDEVRLNPALEAAAITPYETDLADLIVQLGHDQPSHIVVPALHRNKAEIRRLFMEEMNLTELGETAEDLAAAARAYLREKFLRVKVGFSGANFAIAESGSVCVVESEGNGRMCVSLPELLITLVGVEKIIPTFDDLEVFLQLLARSATGERMNPYNSIWTGVAEGDGPREFHVVLLDNGRSGVLADSESRETLDCIRCGACLNACPVYRQTGGHAYGSIYAGPIGAILTPQLQSLEHSQSLPYASSLCGACLEVCPVEINIPEILIHLRSRLVEQGYAPLTERIGMKAAAVAFADGSNLETAQTLARIGQAPLVRDGMIRKLPGMLGGWTASRDLKAIPGESFRDWWSKRPVVDEHAKEHV